MKCMSRQLPMGIGAMAATLTIAGLMGAGAAAAAPPDPGQTEGPVRFVAADKGDCNVQFNIDNNTNITSYTIDFLIDNEPAWRDTWETEVGLVGRTAGLHSVADAPSFPENPNTPETPMVKDRETKSVSYVLNLKTGLKPGDPALPNAEADTHTVQYRMVLGPPGNLGDGGPEWIGDRQWHEVTVTGCNPSSSGSSGSSVGSIFGGLGF